jgi:hypothetical protein
MPVQNLLHSITLFLTDFRRSTVAAELVVMGGAEKAKIVARSSLGSVVVGER